MYHRFIYLKDIECEVEASDLMQTNHHDTQHSNSMLVL
jgi:hypothetical protein